MIVHFRDGWVLVVPDRSDILSDACLVVFGNYFGGKIF